MLSIATININQAWSYYASDDYYARSDGECGQWYGDHAAAHGLTGDIKKDDFDSELTRMNPERVGFDFCFSAPKSCSIAMNINEDLRQAITEAWNDSLRDALKYIEDNYIGYRKKDNYHIDVVKSGNMECAVFNHFVSREQDPQLHSHCVIVNETGGVGRDYKLTASEMLYENKMFLGQYQRNEFARQLQLRGIRIEVTDKKQGFFEIEGFTKDHLDPFSTRRKEIASKLQEWGRGGESGAIASKAALKTREAKENKDLDLLRDSWRIDFKELGIDSRIVQQGRPESISNDEKKQLMDRVASNLSGLSVAFRKENFSRAVLKEGLGFGIVQKDIDSYIEERIKDKGFLISRQLNERGFPREMLATKESVDLENTIYERVGNGKGTLKVIDPGAIERHIQATTLKPEQAACVRHICGSPDKYVAVQGYAGTGKTFMLNEARRIWEDQGFIVRGMSFTGKAAEGLAKEARIESSTIHSLLNSLEKEAGNNTNEDYSTKTTWNFAGLRKRENEVWVVDEAGMTDNRLMSALQDAATARGAKVIFIGDFRQLQPVGAGNAFGNLIKENIISYAEMKDIQRQKEATLKDAVIHAARGEIRESLEKLSGKVAEYKDRKERLAEIAKDFTSIDSKERKGVVILTGSNSDRSEINRLVRAELREKGELQPGIVTQIKGQKSVRESREFSVEDKIVFLQNNRGLGVMNGQTGYIRKVGDGALKIESGDKMIEVDLAEYGHIDHGYAMTVHKAQGITENKALIHIDTRQRPLNNANAYYVDISRARHDVKIYTDDKSKLFKAIEKQQVKSTSRDFKEAFDSAKLSEKIRHEIGVSLELSSKAEAMKSEAQRLREKATVRNEKGDYKFLRGLLSKFELHKSERLYRLADSLEMKSSIHAERADCLINERAFKDDISSAFSLSAQNRSQVAFQPSTSGKLSEEMSDLNRDRGRNDIEFDL